MKTEITADERLQLIGLLTLGQQAMNELNRVEQAIVSLTGQEFTEGGYSGHIGDTLYESDCSPVVSKADRLLRLLGLTAQPAHSGQPGAAAGTAEA